MNTSAEAVRLARRAAIVAWLVLVAALGFVMLIVYIVYATVAGDTSSCPGFTLFLSGGAASDGAILTAAVLGGILWVTAGVAAFVLRQRLGQLAFGFTVAYSIGLVLLWNVAPLIWGLKHC